MYDEEAHAQDQAIAADLSRKLARCVAALEAMKHAYGIDGTGSDRKAAHLLMDAALAAVRGESHGQ